MSQFLIVEDQEEVANIWKRFLEPMGVPVAIALNLEEAAAVMRKVPPPDLVLLDLILPDSKEPSETLAKGIKMIREHNPNALVVVITGAAVENIAVLARAMGADEFYHKIEMTSQARLLNAVKGVLEKNSEAKDVKARVENGTNMIAKLTGLLRAQG